MTFPAGLAALVRRCLDADLRGVQVSYEDESALLLATAAPARAVAALPYLKNVFDVLLTVPRGPLGHAAATVARRVSRAAPPGLARLSDFRVMAQLDGRLEPLDRHARQTLERAVAAATGARVRSRGGGDELWLVGRRDLPTIVLARRLTHAAAPGPAGSLGPELSHLLVRLSQPRPDDVFLDPFAGSGVLCRVRAQSAARRVVASDRDARPQPFGATTAPVQVLREDARELPSLATGSVSVVVTDPPWGEFEAFDTSPTDFYAATAASLRRVLDPAAGRVVLLVSRAMAPTVRRELGRAGFQPSQELPLLVHGHPATVLCARVADQR